MIDVDDLKDLSDRLRKLKGVVNKTTHARVQTLAWPDRDGALSYYRGMLVELREEADKMKRSLEGLELDLASEMGE